MQSDTGERNRRLAYDAFSTITIKFSWLARPVANVNYTSKPARISVARMIDVFLNFAADIEVRPWVSALKRRAASFNFFSEQKYLITYMITQAGEGHLGACACPSSLEMNFYVLIFNVKIC